jgi:hypothetical protein
MGNYGWMKMKRAILIVLVLALLGSGAVYAAVSEVVKPVPATVTIVLLGDATQDDILNSLDITKVERIIAGLDTPTPGGDANLDGSINAIDITKVERLIAHLD